MSSIKEKGPQELLLQMVKVLQGLNINYFVTGGFAVSLWGRPRSTLDIDIVIKLIGPQVIHLAKALRAISKAGYIDENMAKEAIRLKREFNFIDPDSRLKVDFWITKDDARALLEFKRKKLKKIDGQKVYFVSPEDLILSKLAWYQQSQSSRQLEDIESIIKISGKKLDIRYLKTWAKKLGYSEILNKLLK